METTITQKQVELFYTTVRSLADILGLNDWDIRLETYVDDSENAVQAEARESISGRIGVIRLNLHNVIDNSDDNIIKLAIHETLHILLSEEWNMCSELITELPEDRRVSYITRLNGIQHATINRLTRILKGEYNGNV